MKRIHLLTYILVIWMGAGFLGCAQPQRLSWRLASGDSYSLKVNMVSDFRIAFALGADHKETAMLLNCRVHQIDQQQQATVEVTITSLKASMKSMGIQFSYDSDKDTGPKPAKKGKEGHQQRFINAFAGLKGEKYKALLNSQGQVIKLFDMDKNLKKVAFGGSKGDMFGGDQVKMLLLEQNLREYVTGGLLAGTKEATSRTGETWQAPSAVVMPYCPIVPLQKTFTVQNFRDRQDPNIVQDRNVVAINYKITRSEDKPAPSPSKRSKIGKRKTSIGFGASLAGRPERVVNIA